MATGSSSLRSIPSLSKTSAERILLNTTVILKRLKIPESIAAHPLLRQNFESGAKSLYYELIEDIREYEQRALMTSLLTKIDLNYQ
jgi:hypothetical protein